jgi:hypothetical protein
MHLGELDLGTYPMTWIKTIPPPEADESLRAAYEQLQRLYPLEYGQENPTLKNEDGHADSIVAAHSLLPGVMTHMMAGFALLLSPDLPLTRRQHEMIATIVSVKNRCFY